MSGILFCPYCTIDGIPTLKDSDLAYLFERMERDRSVEKVFYAGEVRNRDQFIAFFHQPSQKLWLAMEGDFCLGFCWLNTFEGMSARIHFNLFHEARVRRGIKAGQSAMNTLLSMQNNNRYVLDCLIGVTPVENKAACRYVQAAGMVRVGEIPSMLWNAYSEKSMDAMITHCTRDNL